MNRPLLFAGTILLALGNLGCDDRKAQVATPQARVATSQAQLNEIKNALSIYYMDFRAYPADLDVLTRKSPGRSGRTWGPYTLTKPLDPWGQKYIYRPPATEGAAVTLLSVGPDGTQGGGDDVLPAP